MPFRSTAQRFSLLNISLRNNTFCFWDQLVGGWPLFSPPGAPIRHAGPGPEPKPGREPEPRRWHTDRQSDPLAGPGFRPGHRLLVQDTRQIERHTGGEERRVKVRHDSVARAAFLVLAFDEGKEKQALGGRWGRRRRRRKQESRSRGKSQKWHVTMEDPLWLRDWVFDPPNVLICEVYFKPLLLSMLPAS